MAVSLLKLHGEAIGNRYQPRTAGRILVPAICRSTSCHSSTADENGTDTQDAVGQTAPDNGATTAAFRCDDGDDDWEEPGTSNEKTTDEILDEYWDRKAKTHRLKQRLAETSDPAMREFYENQINIENEILDVLQEEAAERGIDLDSPLPPQPEPPTDADEEGDADESDGFDFLDGIQLALDGAGMMPGVGIVADALNAAISLGRGDLIGAGLNALAMIPIIGQGVKALDKAADAAKAADKAVDAARAADKAADAARGAGLLEIPTKGLQKVFDKHGADFGLSGNWNPSRAADVLNAIKNHMGAAGTKIVEGTYRGQRVFHYVGPATGLNVITDLNGKFIGGWKLGLEQLESVLMTGRLF